jgi:hypothetical protein
MALIDFAEFVRRYRLKTWRVNRVSVRMAHVFSQHFVLGLTGAKTHDAVVSRTNTIRQRWAIKLKELAIRALWLPVARLAHPDDPDFDFKKFRLSFQRCLFCRPTYMFFRWKKDVALRPCNWAHICPFCYARISTAQYRDVKNKLRALGRHNKDTKLIVTCRVATRFITAPEWDPRVGCGLDVVKQYERLVWGELQRERNAYNKQTKQLGRKTMGSMWRLAVVPQDNGWLIEARQFFLHAPKTKLPCVRVRGSRVTYIKSLKVAECYEQPDTEFFYLFGEFNKYPMPLLDGYDELVAAYLRAVHGMRLLAGTGILRAVGRGLVDSQKRKGDDAKTKTQSPERSAAAEARIAQAQDRARGPAMAAEVGVSVRDSF